MGRVHDFFVNVQAQGGGARSAASQSFPVPLKPPIKTVAREESDVKGLNDYVFNVIQPIVQKEIFELCVRRTG
jgi:hypothetical protein